MKKVSLIWIIAAFFNSAVSAGNWLATTDGKIFYMETAEKYRWYDAVNICSHLKMSLISMDSAKKTEDVYNLYRAHFGTSDVQFWTGGHDLNVSKHFEWIATGEAIGYTNWLPSHPTSGYHCIEMYTSSSLKWYDYACHATYGFVCEETPLQDVTNAEVELLKASLDNQTKLLKEKTEELDSLRNELEKIKNTLDIQTNLKLEFDELKKSYEEMKQIQEEFVISQKSLAQQMTKLSTSLQRYGN